MDKLVFLKVFFGTWIADNEKQKLKLAKFIKT
jgi:hypothetical protein